MLSEDALIYMKKNSEIIANKVLENETNEWVSKILPHPIFIEKKYEIEDFELTDNPESKDKIIDFNNSIVLYEKLHRLPRYIISDERFWLWLHLDKFYSIVRLMMKINGKSTIENMWMHTQGVRRGLTFGVLSRCYLRVALTIDTNKEDKYELTRWAIDNPIRFRELTWRTYSSEEHIVRGALRGEKRAIDENPSKENNDFYPIIAKYISNLGSVRLLDLITEEDMSEFVYKKMIELINKGIN